MTSKEALGDETQWKHVNERIEKYNWGVVSDSGFYYLMTFHVILYLQSWYPKDAFDFIKGWWSAHLTLSATTWFISLVLSISTYTGWIVMKYTSIPLLMMNCAKINVKSGTI